MFNCLIGLFLLLCSSVADENSVRDADIFPSSPEIERGSTLKLYCFLGKHYTPQRNASHIIWKLNRELIAQENYNTVNSTISSVTIHNFTYNKAHVQCFMKYPDKEQLLVHTEVESGFPPDTPTNISCTFYFNTKLTCTWNSGRETYLMTNYTLYRKMMSEGGVFCCESKTESCSFHHPHTPYSSSSCFQVKAENVLGEASSDCIPIPMENIVKLDPPEILSVERITDMKQLLTVTWKMPEKIISSKKFSCQVQYRNLYSNSSEIVMVPLNYGEKTGSCNLTGLWDSTEYSVAVRCISVGSMFWSEWSRGENASTEEKAPSEKVDLWRVIESSPSSGSRFVHLLWKPLKNFPPSGRVLGYKIQYFPENDASLKRTNFSVSKNVSLLLNEEAYRISVTAYNSAGYSPEAVLRIPSTNEKTSQIIETVRTFTTNEDVFVEWTASEAEVTEYIVEWYKELETNPFGRSWQYITNSTVWRANKKNFKPFICYNISVYPLYGNTVVAPYSIQTYVQEKKPSEGPMADTGIPGKNEVTIKWKEISKDKRNGFLSNYTIFYKPEDGKELNETVNSDVLQYRLKSLKSDTQYTVYIMASNEAGGTSGEPKTFKTLKFDKEDIIFIALPIGLSMLSLLGLWIMCILKKNTFKKVCWPDIPNPVGSIAVGWPLDTSKNNSFLEKGIPEDKPIDSEDLSVLEYCFPEGIQEGALLINCESQASEYIYINTKGMVTGDKKRLYNEENEITKCLSSSMPYIITDQDNRSQRHLALIPVKESQPTEMLEDDLSESQETSTTNEENDNEEVLKLEDCSERAPFNPYLKNSVKTREFLISEHSKKGCNSQSTVLPPVQQGVAGQSYVTLDMFRPATGH